MKLQIGITGGIGSGKSLISHIFSLLKVPVYNADTRAKWLMSNDSLLIKQIKNYFGNLSYLSDGSLNREYISKNVFNNKTNIAYLNDLVHPRVGEDYKHWVQRQVSSHYVLKEAALLFETGSYKQLDKIITVYAPLEVRLDRTLKRDRQRSKEQILSINGNQLDDEIKMTKADFIIYNDGSKLVIPQVLELDSKFREL